MKERLAFVAALALAAPATAAPPAAAGQCRRVLVKAPGTQSARGISYLSVTRDVDIHVLVLFDEKQAGDHLVELDFRTPRGHRYQRMAIPVAADGQAGQFRAVPGYPRPVRVQGLQPHDDAGQPSRVLKTRLPLAGTSIVKSSLYGDWRVDVYVDGAREACGSAEFAIGR